jgi:hypothetical protein
VTTSRPPRGDREAARQWLRERGFAEQSGLRPTHVGLLREQRDRLLGEAGFDSATGALGTVNLDLVLDGPSIVDHSASISMLGSLFVSFQSTVTAVAQALEGTPTTAGQVAGYITAATQLRSLAAYPSSYGLHLVGPDTSMPGWEQGALPIQPTAESLPSAVSTSGLLPDAIGALLDITDLAQPEVLDGTPEPLMERLVPLGQRALGHLASLAGTLATYDANLKMTWQPETTNARSGSLSASAAVRLKSLSEGVQFGDADQRRIEGELVEASLRRGSVMIELDSGTIISARTEAVVTSRLRDDLLGKRVVAEALVTVAKYAGGRQREIYVVTDIASANS